MCRWITLTCPCLFVLLKSFIKTLKPSKTHKQTWNIIRHKLYDHQFIWHLASSPFEAPFFGNGRGHGALCFGWPLGRVANGASPDRFGDGRDRWTERLRGARWPVVAVRSLDKFRVFWKTLVSNKTWMLFSFAVTIFESLKFRLRDSYLYRPCHRRTAAWSTWAMHSWERRPMMWLAGWSKCLDLNHWNDGHVETMLKQTNLKKIRSIFQVDQMYTVHQLVVPGKQTCFWQRTFEVRTWESLIPSGCAF